jgi:hypothetical protein
MVMIGDENGDVSSYSQRDWQTKSKQNQPLGCFSEQLPENRKLKNIRSWVYMYRLTVLHPCGEVDKQFGQIAWSPFPYPIMYAWGGGLPQKGEGGFSGPNDKPDTDSQPHLTIPYTNSQDF